MVNNKVVTDPKIIERYKNLRNATVFRTGKKERMDLRVCSRERDANWQMLVTPIGKI